jgi:hypothetical protein
LLTEPGEVTHDDQTDGPAYPEAHQQPDHYPSRVPIHSLAPPFRVESNSGRREVQSAVAARLPGEAGRRVWLARTRLRNSGRQERAENGNGAGNDSQRFRGESPGPITRQEGKPWRPRSRRAAHLGQGQASRLREASHDRNSQAVVLVELAETASRLGRSVAQTIVEQPAQAPGLNVVRTVWDGTANADPPSRRLPRGAPRLSPTPCGAPGSARRPSCISCQGS